MTTGRDHAVVALVEVMVRRGRRQVLHGITLSVPAGAVVGLLGPSGCGKTTLMRTIVGVQAGVTGTVRVLDAPAGAPRVRHRIGYMTQDASVYDDLSVSENLGYFGRLLGVDDERVAATTSAVRLDDHAHVLVERLSGGQRARVSLGVALLARPDLLVLDEPTVGLDPVLREELWHDFTELARTGSTLLVSSHVMDEAARCDTLILLRDGRVLATGSPAELMSRTGSHSVEEAFLRLVDRGQGA